MSQHAGGCGVSHPAGRGKGWTGGGKGGKGGGKDKGRGARQPEDPETRKHVLAMPFPYSVKKDFPENWFGFWKKRASEAGLHLTIRAMRQSFWNDRIPQETGVNNSLCVRSLSPNDPGASTAAYEFYVELIEDLHEKGKEMPELDYSDVQEESEDIEADEVKITMYGNTVYINKHKEMQAARVETQWSQFDVPGAVPHKRVLMHRFPARHIRYIKAPCPLPPPLPKAACPLPPLPEASNAKQWLEQPEEQEAARQAGEDSEAAATRGTEAQEASQARTESEANADKVIAEQIAGMSMKAEFQEYLASQVRRALQTAAEASDFLQRPDPNFLSALCYYVCFTLCVWLVSMCL